MAKRDEELMEPYKAGGEKPSGVRGLINALVADLKDRWVPEPLPDLLNPYSDSGDKVQGAYTRGLDVLGATRLPSGTITKTVPSMTSERAATIPAFQSAAVPPKAAPAMDAARKAVASAFTATVADPTSRKAAVAMDAARKAVADAKAKASSDSKSKALLADSAKKKAAAKTAATAAGQKAIAVGNKLTKGKKGKRAAKAASVSKKLLAIGNRLASKVTSIKGLTVSAPSAGRWSGGSTPVPVADGSSDGSSWATDSAALLAHETAVISSLHNITDATSAATSAGTIFDAVDAVLVQLDAADTTGTFDSLITAGQDIEDRCNGIIDLVNNGNKTFSTSIMNSVAPLQADATSWQQQAQAALAAAPPGTPGAGTPPLPGAPWAPSTSYTVGSTVTNYGNTYQAVTGGVSAATGSGPTSTTGTVQDGTVTWMFSGFSQQQLPGAPWAPSTSYTVGSTVTNYGNTYQAVTGGVSAATGSGPTSTTGTVQDGTVTWMFSGFSQQQQSFDPGSYGGGGGGGGGGDDGGGGGGGGFDDGDGDDGGLDSPESQELQQFRQTGQDPFEDEPLPGDDVDQYNQDDSWDDGGGVAPATDFDDDASTVLSDFRSSGEDPFADDSDASVLGAPIDDVDDENVLGSDWWDPFGVSADQSALNAKTRTPSPLVADPAKAAALAAAKQRLLDAQAALNAFHAQQGKALAAGSPRVDASNFAQRLAAAQQQFNTGGGDDGDAVMGIDELAEEAADIIYQSYQQQITDEEPDVMRRRGSVHRGAAYLQDINYPPHGSSGGQEGGSMRPDETIDILGCNYARGLDVLGAGVKKVSKVVPRAGFVKKTTATGRKYTALVPVTTKGNHAASIKNAHDVGKRAVSVGNKLLAALKKAPAAKATKVHGVVARRVTRVVPARGRVAAGKHVRLSPARLKQIANTAIASGKKLSGSADKHATAVKNDLARINAGIKTAQKASHTAISGQDLSILGAYCELIGEQITVDSAAELTADLIYGLATSPPDPNDPGWLMDGSVDPNYTPGAATVSMAPPDPNNPGYLTDGTVDPNYAGSADPGATDPTYGLGPAPTAASVAPQPGVDYAPDPGPDTDQTFYSSDPSVQAGAPLPLGAIYYDGQKGFPYYSAGSYTRYYPQKGPGLELTDSWWGSGQYHGAAWSVFRGNGDDQNTINDDEAANLQATSSKWGYGPLVGNPNRANASGHEWNPGLRYDGAKRAWFWYRDKAPTWATAPDDMLRLNQAILDYQTQLTAAKADAAAQAAQDQLDQQAAAQLTKQQALDDAAQQRQYDQEQADAEHQAQLQSVSDDAAASQQQAQANIDQQAYEAQADVEAKAYQAQSDVDASRAERQVDIDAKAEQAAEEAARRLDALTPPPDDGSDQGSGEDDEGGYEGGGGGLDDSDGGMDMDAESDSDNTVLGLSGVRRLKAKIDHRRG